ncbi:MAG: nucleotidyltransferase domain-containing protein [Coriobacteriia bacterium]|nr:nucleotidyltransferase domain-containing protein [Coriobacteriia bacterium]
MEEQTKMSLLHKNQQIIEMVIERAKRDFADDIGLIGLTGSFNQGDFHEFSDLDLVIVNVTERGLEINFSFILGDVGYDIYCTPWEPRLASQSVLESPMAAELLDMEVLYVAKPEHLDMLTRYRQAALDELAKPIGRPCLDRAAVYIAKAKEEYANALLAEETSAVRLAVGGVLYNSVNAVVSMNNTYLKHGPSQYLEELRAYQYLPRGFETDCLAIVSSKDLNDIRDAAFALLKGTVGLYLEMVDRFVDKLSPTSDNLRGTYEELWCNYRNKIIRSADAADKSATFFAAYNAQQYLDEMTGEVSGTPKFDLLRHFDPDDLHAVKTAFVTIMDEYLKEYIKVGREAEVFNSFDELYAKFMQT